MIKTMGIAAESGLLNGGDTSTPTEDGRDETGEQRRKQERTKKHMRRNTR
jgi:hypothetical protein